LAGFGAIGFASVPRRVFRIISKNNRAPAAKGGTGDAPLSSGARRQNAAFMRQRPERTLLLYQPSTLRLSTGFGSGLFETSLSGFPSSHALRIMSLISLHITIRFIKWKYSNIRNCFFSRAECPTQHPGK
jgi:hypothetical protein